jgi:hypothetical protein
MSEGMAGALVEEEAPMFEEEEEEEGLDMFSNQEVSSSSKSEVRKKERKCEKRVPLYQIQLFEVESPPDPGLKSGTHPASSQISPDFFQMAGFERFENLSFLKTDRF